VTPDQRQLRDTLAGAPAAAATASTRRVQKEAPQPGAWSAREVVLHLTAVEEEVWQSRLDALASGAFPQWSWVEPGLWVGPGAESLAGALAAFDARRAATVHRLDGLDAAGWARQGNHATYGVLDVAALLRIAVDHDAEHIAQIRDS
jgi:DinB family protein